MFNRFLNFFRSVFSFLYFILFFPFDLYFFFYFVITTFSVFGFRENQRKRREYWKILNPCPDFRVRDVKKFLERLFVYLQKRFWVTFMLILCVLV